jgi:hypothetical protein
VRFRRVYFINYSTYWEKKENSEIVVTQKTLLPKDATCTAHLLPFDFITQIMFGE